MQHTEDNVLAAPHAPRGICGSIRVPASKSLTQRALVAVALAGNGASVHEPLDAEDPRLLFTALQEVGFLLAWRDGTITASGRRSVDHAELQLGNNGTGARLLLAQLAALPGRWRLDGAPRLRQRPMAPLVTALRRLGGVIEAAPAEASEFSAARAADALPLLVHGRALTGGEIALDAALSSQFMSALLLLGAMLPAGLKVRLDSLPPSRPYLDLTAEVLAAFGAVVRSRDDGRWWHVRGGGLKAAAYAVEGDWSAAAFPLAAAAVAGGEVEVVGVRDDSRQGDAIVLRLLAQTGCETWTRRGRVGLRGPAQRPLNADLRDTPDLFPALAAVAAVAGGRLTGLAGLAAKESDRVAVMADRLARLGFVVASGPDFFHSSGACTGRCGDMLALDPAADHRVAMALAVAACAVPDVRIADPGCVAKSWPSFWSAWQGITSLP